MIEVNNFDEKGRGIAGDMYVPFCYPGDIVEAELTNRRKKRGKLISVIHPSPFRQHPPCSYFGSCGGCPWQGLKYEAQLKFKEERVKFIFEECRPIIPSPETFFYRNRMDFAFGPNYSIGLKGAKDNIIDIEKCWLMSDESNAIVKRLRNFISAKKLLNYKDGIMRHVVIREGKNEKNAILNILTSDKGVFPLNELWENAKDLVNGIVWSINLSPADRSYGEIQSFIGQDHFTETLNGIRFKIPAQSFFQTNTHQAEKLLEIVKDFAGLEGAETVLDLFSGTGSIGLYLARNAKEVVGIEENQDAAELSKTNARLNGIDNFSAIAGRVEDIMNTYDKKAQLVILDPPRPGVHKKALLKIGEIKPNKIVYVSCNPTTQKQDIDILKEFGYKIENCQPLDMFPHTPHIENIILLKT